MSVKTQVGYRSLFRQLAAQKLIEGKREKNYHAPAHAKTKKNKQTKNAQPTTEKIQSNQLLERSVGFSALIEDQELVLLSLGGGSVGDRECGG